MSFRKVLFGNFCFLMLLSLFSTGCSRKASQQTVLRFDLSSKLNGASSNNGAIENIIINVSSGSIFEFYEWDCEREDCSLIAFETKASGTTLVQLLAITEDGTEVTRVNYGDVQKNLQGGDNVLSIELNEIGNFQKEARVLGRYIPSGTHPLAGQALTGRIDVSAFVGVGKPDMKVFDTEIFAGWFNLFLLDDMGFKYRFTGYNKNGNFAKDIPIFNDLHDAAGMTTSSSGVQASGRTRVHYSLAQAIYEQRDGELFQEESFDTKIVGFFGLNPDNRLLCADSLSPSTLFDGTTGAGFLCKDVNSLMDTCISYFNWSDFSVQGSVDGSNSSTFCTSDSSELALDLTEIAEDGEDVVGFFGPFKTPAVGTGELLSFDPTNLTLTWDFHDQLYLPGGVEVFIRDDSSPFDNADVQGPNFGFECDKLSQFGFQSVGRFDVSTKTHTLANVSSNLNVAICPIRPNGDYFGSALITDSHHNNQNQSPPASLVDFKAHFAAADSTPIPGLDFGGSGWATGHPIQMLPESSSTNNQFFITIRNITSDPVSLKNVHVNFFDGYTEQMSPGSTPNGNEDGTCGTLTRILNPAGTSGDRCVFRIDFSPLSPTAYNEGTTLYNALSIETEDPDGNTRWESLNFITPIFMELQYSDATKTLRMYAPQGKTDIKYVQLVNNSGGPAWDLSSLSSSHGNIIFDNMACPTSLTNGSSCIFKVELDNPSGAIADASNNGGNFDIDGGNPSTAALNFVNHTLLPTLSVSSPLDFGSAISSVLQQTVTMTQNSSGTDLFIQNINSPGSPFLLASTPSNTCDGAQISTSATCDFTLETLSSFGAGFYSRWLFIPYSVGDSHHVLDLEVIGDY